MQRHKLKLMAVAHEQPLLAELGQLRYEMEGEHNEKGRLSTKCVYCVIRKRTVLEPVNTLTYIFMGTDSGSSRNTGTRCFQVACHAHQMNVRIKIRVSQQVSNAFAVSLKATFSYLISAYH